MIRIRLERPDTLKDGLTYWEDGKCRYRAVIEQLVSNPMAKNSLFKEFSEWVPVEVVYPDE